jgi:D-alanyl-D-alanine carboxypeptidase (penicillin-binding protein 5/6)
VNGKPVTLIGAILGATSRGQALSDTEKLLESNIASWQEVTALKAGQVVGNYNLPWGKSVRVVANKDLSAYAILDSKISVKVSLKKLTKPILKGSEVGTITIQSGNNKVSSPVVIDQDISLPSVLWKLLHP